MVSPFAGRASPLAVSAPPSNGEADVPFAPEGVMFFVRAPNWCARVERNSAALPAAPFSGELEARSGEYSLPSAPFLKLGLGFDLFGDFTVGMNWDSKKLRFFLSPFSTEKTRA